ncbi:hypothetical protein E1B28_010749 [Marasmius oreades]|uniref:Uncharacterized protein n=1 Tax=Marasmius oreades TaxID=181124 RepID=A0A9P7RSQ6_9AGAR|nr:uncharacterized protein E1B28_010749 [Marasmius oreades]KAG7089039.1 hypothetical protein E1B28_010749 [Marasmius oreades]
MSTSSVHFVPLVLQSYLKNSDDESDSTEIRALKSRPAIHARENHLVNLEP